MYFMNKQYSVICKYFIHVPNKLNVAKQNVYVIENDKGNTFF